MIKCVRLKCVSGKKIAFSAMCKTVSPFWLLERSIIIKKGDSRNGCEIFSLLRGESERVEDLKKLLFLIFEFLQNSEITIKITFDTKQNRRK